MIIPKLSINYKDLEVSFKIGKDRMYILKDIYEFSNAMLNSDVLKYGKELEFKAHINGFSDKSKSLAKYITKKASEYNEFSTLGNYYFTLERRYKGVFKLKYGSLDDFFDVIKENFEKIEIENYNYQYGYVTLVEDNPILNFNVKNSESGIDVEHDYEDYYIFEGQEYVYILYKDKLYRCNKEFQEKTIPLIKEIRKKRNGKISIFKENAASFCEYVIPHIKESSNITIEEGILENFKIGKLGTKVYLDIDNNNDIIADVKFCYGNIEFNPFDRNIKVDVNRNLIAESRTKKILQGCNFTIDFRDYKLHLSKEDDIYEFMQNGINILMQKFEVLVTDKLKNKQIIHQKTLTFGVRIQNDLIKMEIENLDFNEKELVEIFKTYQLKKKFYRLKDGSFLNLESSGIESMVNISKSLSISEKDLSRGEVELPIHRAIYLDHFMKQDENIIAHKENSFKQIIRDIKDISDLDFEIPQSIENKLRNYQKVGYNWLKVLTKYGLGGILADDMGLGKTIQVIALLIDELEHERRTSIVVCPSSLYLNWEKEIKKFAPEIKVLIISGNVEEREELIKRIEDYDVIITSYDLVKRDIEKYDNYRFRYVIADEAQYIKNNSTKNSIALKKLKGNTKFALTGTPMENSLSELWSIFDFVMPGYLFGYKKFKDDFENSIVKDDDKFAMERLQKMVSPFILRRIKKEVLKELPDKTETVMYSEMEEEQSKIYKGYLAKAKHEMELEIKENGFENSQIKILALITRLRQICCHPSLFLDNYNGGSAKLEQCLYLLDDAIKSGHKILVFSQFTSMIDILILKLNEKQIKFSVLTGQTKVDTRVEMVDEFNKSDEIKVFLISLKAGGTGLNLTGADIVIHFDPWWNISAQTQATDRAHRIGQKNNVQVFKLISKDSIEEKIQLLQEKKMNLTNMIVKSGEKFINKMSKEEILDLFE